MNIAIELLEEPCDTSMYYGAENLLYLSLSPSNVKTTIKACEERICQVCNTRNTPLWRRTEEYHTLCNACGIRKRIKNSKKTTR